MTDVHLAEQPAEIHPAAAIVITVTHDTSALALVGLDLHQATHYLHLALEELTRQHVSQHVDSEQADHGCLLCPAKE